MAVRVVGLPIRREPDGLAMSRCGAARAPPAARPPCGLLLMMMIGQLCSDLHRHRRHRSRLGLRAAGALHSLPPRPAARSRNALLSAEDRQRCTCISRALFAARDAALAGQLSDAGALQRQVADAIAGGGGRVDYVEVVHARTLRPLPGGGLAGQAVLVAVAAHFGRVRLIDNVDFDCPPSA